MRTSVIFGTLFCALGMMKSAQALTLDEATDLVKKKLAVSEVASAKHYCVKGTITCRTMYTLRDKATKAPVDMYYDSFYSADRQVGSTCYFVPNESGSSSEKTYHQVSDTVFDGSLAINLQSTDSAQISGDQSARLFSGLNFKRLGTSRYILGSMSQSEDKIILEGAEYDSADPSYRVPVNIEYLRIYP